MGREGKTSLQEGARRGRHCRSSLEFLVASTERSAEGRALVLPMNPCMSGVHNQAGHRSYLALSHCEPHTFTRAVGPGPFQREAQGLPDRDTAGCVPRGALLQAILWRLFPGPRKADSTDIQVMMGQGREMIWAL